MQQVQPRGNWLNVIGNVVASLCLSVFLLTGFSMSDASFVSVLSDLEKFGMVIGAVESVIAVTVFCSLLCSLRTTRDPLIWRQTACFFVIALTANLFDYWSTIFITPDLALEKNPVWNAHVRAYGLQVSLLGGLLTKIGLSILAATCYAFYQKHAAQVAAYVRGTNDAPRLSFRARFVAMSGVLSFYFAWMNLICFYVAGVNCLVADIRLLPFVPPLPAVIMVFLVAITAALWFLCGKVVRNDV